MKTRNESGQAIILIVFAIIGLVGITALAVDGGNAFLARRDVQNTADNAALAGALARIKGQDWAATTFAAANVSGYNNDGTTNTVTVSSPPQTGEFAGNIEYIQVRITYNAPTYFAGVLGIRYVTVSGEATARTKSPELTQILNGSAIISLAPTSDCENKRSFWVHGEATLSVSGGEIFINSNNPTCALITNGSGSIRMKDGLLPIRMVGGANIQKPKLITPYPPQTGAVPISYPPPFLMPDVKCGKDAAVSEDGMSMTPGGWEEDVFPPDDVKFLEPGTYCVRGNFILQNGRVLEGNGVTIIVIDGKVEWHLGAEINLRAPEKGDNAGLLLYLPLENKKTVSLNGNIDSSFRGTILAPGSKVRLLGPYSKAGLRSQIIGYTIEADGQANVVIDYRNEDNFDTYTMPEIQLSQ